jgi:hypothetical protein
MPTSDVSSPRFLLGKWHASTQKQAFRDRN